MEITQIQFQDLSLSIHAHGAEMQQLLYKNTQVLWDKDEQYWNRIAPILFPIVGRLKNDEYQYLGKSHKLSQHGFARNAKFERAHHSQNSVRFVLKDSAETHEIFPFPFELWVDYTLESSVLHLTHTVKNTSPTEVLPFSIGGHPGFKLHKPLESYALVFNESGTKKRWLLKEGNFNGQTEFIDLPQGGLPLSDDLFADDAIVFKNEGIHSVTLLEDGLPLLTVRALNAPYWGIWKKVGAPFLCIEPWQGVADSFSSTGQLLDKEGLILLPPNQEHIFHYTIEFTL